MATEVLEVIIKGNADNLQKVTGAAGSALSGLANIGKTVLVAGLAVGTVAVTALGAGLGFAIGEAMEAQAGLAQLEAVLKSTGGAAGVTKDMALDLADGLSSVTRFSDDAILAGENLLLTFTNIGADVFPRATETLLDMATAMGTDAKSGAIQLGKALNDPVAGITALTRVGVTFTDEQKKMIEAMVEAGDVAGAQTIILDELQKEFGGSAEAAGQTFAGQLDILKNSLANVAEGIGMALLPLLQSFMNDIILPLVPLLQAAGTALAGIFEAVASGNADGAFDILRNAILDIGLQLGFTKEDLLTFNLKLTEIWDWINTDGKQILEDFKTALATFGEWLQGDGKAAWDDFVLSLQPVVTAFTTLATTFQEDLPLMQEKADEFVVWATENFGAPLELMIENLKEAWNSLVDLTASDLNQMTGFWEEHKNEIMTILGIVAQFVTVTIGGFLLLASGLLRAGLAVMQGDWSGAWDAIKETLSTFFELALSIVGTNTEEFKSTWSGTFELIALAFNTWKDQLLLDFSTWILNFLGTWETNWNQFELIIDTIIGNIIGFFTELKSTITGVIAYVQTLINKILDIPGIPGGGSTTGGGGGGVGTTDLRVGEEPGSASAPNGESSKRGKGEETDWQAVYASLTPEEKGLVQSMAGGMFASESEYAVAIKQVIAARGRKRYLPREQEGNQPMRDKRGRGRGAETFPGGDYSISEQQPAQGNIIYQLIINSQAGIENILDDFAMLQQLAGA